MNRVQQPKNNNSINDEAKKKSDTSMKLIKPKKTPIIRQTLTSMYRIAKANPLLVYDKDKNDTQCDDFGVNKIKLPKSVLQHNSTNRSLNTNRSLHVSADYSNTTGNGRKNRLSLFSSNSSLRMVKSNPPKSLIKPTLTSSQIATKSTAKPIKYQPPLDKRPFNNNQSSKVNKPNMLANRRRSSSAESNRVHVNINQVNKVNTLANNKRRSLSAEHYDRKKGISKTKIEQPDTTDKKTHNNVDKKSVFFASTVMSPVVEETSFEFRSIEACKRRSVKLSYLTPTPFKRHHYSSTPRPVVSELQKRLQEWLHKHKKPVENYKHLKCFGISCDDENKENMEDPKLSISSSYEDLKIPYDSNAGEDTNDYENNRIVAQGVLSDLLKLIRDGYPVEQCEAWLGMIRQKYADLEEEYQYWECRAAIEQARGDIITAVDCLRSAIVQGAEVKAVDESLEQLLHKFSLLNINITEKNAASKNQRAKIMSDARTVFKSSIIQFAVQERTLKKKQKDEHETSEKKYMITPVRRSTRRSRSRYISTPGVQICTSLQELDQSVCDNSDFCINTALANAFRY